LEDLEQHCAVMKSEQQLFAFAFLVTFFIRPPPFPLLKMPGAGPIPPVGGQLGASRLIILALRRQGGIHHDENPCIG
jgi:hypothetical protein